MAIDNELANGLLKYVPMPVQEAFHRSKARVRLLLGGNASGKTISAMADSAFEAMSGVRCGVLPNHGWIVRPSFSRQPQTDAVWARIFYGDEHFEPFVPRQFQKQLTGNPKNVLHLTNGSTIAVRSWGQGGLRLQGESPHYVICDEEAPDDYVRELMARLFRKSHGWFSAAVTDTTASSWLVELIERADRGDPDIQVFRMDTRDNIHLDQKQVQTFSEGMDDIELAVRLSGGLRMATGRVYKCWTDANWRDRAEMPLDGTDYAFIDPGIANPCAVLWVRVMKPEHREIRPGVFQDISDLWLFGEYYRRGESDVGKHVGAIFEMNRELRSRPAKYYIDPWAGAARIVGIGNSTKTVMQVWKDAGINVVPASSKRDMFKLERFRATEKCIKLEEKAFPNIYAIRGMKHFNRELFKYVVSGLVDPNVYSGKQRKEEFRGDNHLIFGMESCVVMRVKYIPAFTAETASMTQGAIISRNAWNRIGTGVPLFTSGEMGVMLEPKRGTAEAATNAIAT